jgi:large subunit ribosomal protein L18
VVSEKRRVLGRIKRKRRITKKVRGTDERPRLVVYRSNKHIYAQIVADSSGKTLTGVSTLSKEIGKTLASTGNTEAAQEVGTLIAKKATERGITKVVFDRNGFYFHGRVRALATAAREGGLKF